MKTQITDKFEASQKLFSRHLKKLTVLLMLTMSMTAKSALVDIATEPLVNDVPPLALPNLMYVLDNSLSMRWEHTPDWVAEDFCKSTSDIYNVNCGNSNAQNITDFQLPDGAPPYRSPDFNSQYYNPSIRYLPPLNASGTSLGNQTATTAKKDYYDVLDTGTINLVTSFSDIEWCTSTAYTDCLRNGNYVLPGIVNGKYYGEQNKTQATGTKSLALSGTTTSSKVLGPHYYKIVPGEYCTTAKLTSCNTQSSATATYSFPAKLRWCNSDNLTNCQSLKTGAYQYARYPTVVTKVGVSTITIGSQNSSTTISSILVGSTQLLSATTVASTSANTVASRVAANINLATGFRATSSGSVVTIYAPPSGTTYATPVVTRGAGTKSVTVTAFDKATAFPVPGSFERVDIVSGSTYPRAIGRTDCVASTSSCSYNEELTNFANWYSYYRTRIQMIKTSTSIAFKPIDGKFRIGMVSINSFLDNNLDAANNHYLPIDKFTSGTGSQKEKWYNSLFKAELQSSGKTTGTMLRSALANVGRLYAGKAPTVYNSSSPTGDPVQYSCQQNYTLLTTDGYWNVDTGTNAIPNIQATAQVGNNDAAASNTAPISEGPTASSNTLSDVARYYYVTDLRTSSLGNCTGALNTDVCSNNVFTSPNDENDQQHMTTFTLGLGVDGSVAYTSDYKDASSGDYFDIKNGTKNWPVPVAQTETAVDDLWHAAVNGNGTYFSAKDPNELGSSLSRALTDIDSTVGAAAAAATSTLNPVAGDNVAFLASYATSQWTGNIEAREINTITGLINPDAKWCAEDIGADKCDAPKTKTFTTTGSTTLAYCVTASSTATSCDTEGGTFNSSNNSCSVLIASACTGTMTSVTRGAAAAQITAAKVGPLSDNRTIYMKKIVSGTPTLAPFNAANIASQSLDANYQNAFQIANLSQSGTLSPDQQLLLTPENLVNYLRGQNGFEKSASNLVGTTDNRLYRKREAVMGDVLESKPAFIGKTTSKYLDPGYANFASSKASREGTVYVAANDGMLHAFDATNDVTKMGKERWAFVPTAVIPELYKLADFNYSANHKNYLNGDIIISDICTANCTDSDTAVWKTILVAGQNGGGKSYYALDVTNPDVPTFLWEFSPASGYDVGFTFGTPIVTKLPDTNGTWVVLLTSGYNNANGLGHVFVLNAGTGAVLRDYVTRDGDSTTPSGLAKISAYAQKGDINNTALYVYGGDLKGNLWRFDLSLVPSATNPSLFAKLQVGTGASAVVQPITIAPEIGVINDAKVIFVGTGKYLEKTDLDDNSLQTLYAIKDKDDGSTFTNPRSDTLEMINRTISQTGSSRSISSSSDTLINKRGWFIDLPDSGERMNVSPQLVLGTLQFATIVPTADACSPGGYGWINFVDYRSGGVVAGATIGRKTKSPIVGMNVVYISGVPKTSIVRSDGTIELRPDIPYNQSITGFKKNRVIWRELLE